MTDKPKSFGRKSIQTSLKPRDLMEERRLVDIWTAKIITLFPGAFPGVLGESLTGRALKDRLWQLETIDLRLFGIGKHRNVDDTPAGGGAGMVLRADVARLRGENEQLRAQIAELKAMNRLAAWNCL